MPDTTYLAVSVLTVAVITFALRAIPFAWTTRLRSSAAAQYLAHLMPAGILVILVIYLLRDVTLTSSPYGIPHAIAILLTIALQLWKRNAVLSIVAGTTSYVVLINSLPAALG